MLLDRANIILPVGWSGPPKYVVPGPKAGNEMGVFRKKRTFPPQNETKLNQTFYYVM